MNLFTFKLKYGLMPFLSISAYLSLLVCLWLCIVCMTCFVIPFMCYFARPVYTGEIVYVSDHTSAASWMEDAHPSPSWDEPTAPGECSLLT